MTSLEMDVDDFKGEAEYYTSTDGRIWFSTRWKEFATKNDLQAGKDIVMLFTEGDNDVHINFRIVL
jgi:hypothetical protein